jgi:hypothetical protein
MLFPQAQYEIEFRCQFTSDEEAYQVLPFLKASLKRAYTWFDNYHGLAVFQSGRVLRVSGVSGPQGRQYFLGWKGPDHGRFANFRREFNEETTGQIAHSAILRHFCQAKRAFTPPEIEPELDRAGYTQFMTYSGDSLTGRDEERGLNTKLMHCAILRWPIMVELEKIAATQAEALECQRQLEEISLRYNLERRLVKEEPGTLLYQKLFNREK